MTARADRHRTDATALTVDDRELIENRFHLTDEQPFSVVTAEGERLLGKGWLLISEREYGALTGRGVDSACQYHDLFERLMKCVDGYPRTGRGTIDATGHGTVEMDPAPQVRVNPDGPAAKAALQSLLSERDKLEQRVRTFLAKLDECSPHIDSAFMMMEMRCGPYRGPDYAVELSDLRAALTQTEVP